MSLQTGLGGPVGKDMDERGRGKTSRSAQKGEGWRAEPSGSCRDAGSELPASEAAAQEVFDWRHEGASARQRGEAVEPRATSRGTEANPDVSAKALWWSGRGAL